MTQPGLGIVEAFVLLGAGLFYGYAQLVDWLEQDDTDHVDEAEAARLAYVNGEIDEAEMERRLELALDDDRQQLRQRVEDVPGIGPDTSAALAREFGSIHELRHASREDIEAIHGIGPSTAEAIQSRSYLLTDEELQAANDRDRQ